MDLGFKILKKKLYPIPETDGVAALKLWNMYIDDYDNIWSVHESGGVGVFDGNSLEPY